MQPMPLEKVDFFYHGIKDFYDGDVWVADLEANRAHDDRGKTTHYYD